MQVEIGAESERAADEPAEKRSKHAAEKAHDTGFHKEKLFDVAVGGAKGFQDADFAAALEDGHDQRVDDSERGHGESETAEDAEKKIEDGEENAQADRKSTRLNSSHGYISYAVFCLKKKTLNRLFASVSDRSRVPRVRCERRNH